MGKIKGKKKATKKRSHARKAKPHVPKKKKSKRNNSKKKTRPKSRSTRKRNVKPSRPQQKVRLTGNSTKIKVDSRYAGRDVTILRKTTTFNPPVRIRRDSIGIRHLVRLMKGPALRHFKAIGKSQKNYFYIRLQYDFKNRQTKFKPCFSIGIAKIRNAEQFYEYLIDVVESFHSSLKGYSRDGFQDIRFTALIVQGYKK